MMRLAVARCLGATSALAIACAMPWATAAAGLPFQEPLPPPRLPASAPAMRYANLSPVDCRKVLAERELPVRRDHGPAKGVATPLRLSAPLHGVRFIAPRSPSPFGKLDCRLALALDELAEVLEPFGVSSVRVDNMYRPHARLRRGKKSQHAYGLAVDIMELGLSDGRSLVVERDWHAPVGSSPCGPEAAPEPATDEAVLLRNIVCKVARQGIFHHMLTPSYNAAHESHFHFDIKRDEKRGVVE